MAGWHFAFEEEELFSVRSGNALLLGAGLGAEVWRSEERRSWVELTLEEAGKPGAGLVGHLAPATARQLRAALATALKEMGEAP